VSNAPITLILLPGMDGTGELFEPFVQALNPNIKTKVVSYPKTEVLSYAELIKLASTYIPPNQPYILLGESFSGPIAIALAAQADSQLKGLILSCTFARNPRLQLSKLSFLVPTFPINKLSFSLMSKLLMAKFNNTKIRQRLFDAVTSVASKVIRARLDAVIGVDYTEMLGNLNLPILYLQGKNDYLVPSTAGRYITEQAKNVELIELNAPHLLLQLAPIEAAACVQAFIAKFLVNPQ
jgi:pimeloyl-ACP methyl ester carboxylesterase